MSDCFDHMQDAWDDALFGATANGMGEGYRVRRFMPPTCKYCGQRGLKWHQSLHGLTLMQGDHRHTCTAYRGRTRSVGLSMFDDLGEEDGADWGS